MLKNQSPTPEQRLNEIYSERNQLVAALSKFYPSSLEQNKNKAECADGFNWICFIEAGIGRQMSWHIADTDLHHFDHLPRNLGTCWDGHTTFEKYEALGYLKLAVLPEFDGSTIRSEAEGFGYIQKQGATYTFADGALFQHKALSHLTKLACDKAEAFQRKCVEQQVEINRLKEIEWMYNDLCK